MAKRKTFEHLTLDTIRMHYEAGKLDFDISMQRDEGAWPREKRKNFIYTLLNSSWADIPKIYFHKRAREDGTFVYEVVDGKQRLLTALEYLTGKTTDGKTSRLSFNPKNPQYTEGVSDCIGKKFSDLPPGRQEDIRECVFDVVMLKDYPEDALTTIFTLLQEGVALKPQEKRNAVRNWYSKAVEVIVREFDELFDTIKLRERGAERKKLATHLLAITLEPDITTSRGPVDHLYLTTGTKEKEISDASDLVVEFLEALDALVSLYTESDSQRIARKFNETQIVTLMLVHKKKTDWFSEDNIESLKVAWDDFHKLKEAKSPITYEYDLISQQGGNTPESRNKRSKIFIDFVGSSPYGLS